MNQIDAFIYFLEQMDIKMLDEVLTEDISYCGTTKKIFLEKIEGVFDYNATLNNKTLAVERYVNNPNCINFFSWDAQFWENSLLITENNGSIISFNNKKNTDSHSKYNFRIYEDEEIGFVKNTELIILQNKCKNAIDLISNVVLTTALIQNWVRDYRFLYEKINEEFIFTNIKYLEEFIGLWEVNDFFEDLIQKYTLAETALNDYTFSNNMEWIEKHSNTFHCELMPSNTNAVFLCDKNYRYRDGLQIYESKELYLVHKFTDLYFNTLMELDKGKTINLDEIPF